MNNILIPELKKLYTDGRLIPFIGAGVSMSLTWEEAGVAKRGPSWAELVNEAIRQLNFEEPDLLRVRGTDLQILEYYWQRKHTLAPLTHWLHREMQPPEDALFSSPIHSELAQMTMCNLIYTTNYDNFIERSFESHERDWMRIARESDMGIRMPNRPSDPCEIVKFHGDLDFPDEMVISESHYEQRLKLEAAMDYRLRSDLLGRALLFVGYGFHDWNVSYLFRRITDQFKSLQGSVSGYRAYIIVSDPSDFEYKLFAARGIGVVGINSKDPTLGVVKVLSEIRS